MKPDRISRKTAKLEAKAERTIDAAYEQAFETVMAQNSAALSAIRRVLDGETKPPFRCVTEAQKAAWRGKEVRRILQETGLQMALYRAAQRAGNTSAEAIRSMINSEYEAAYEGTLKHLRG